MIAVKVSIKKYKVYIVYNTENKNKRRSIGWIIHGSTSSPFKLVLSSICMVIVMVCRAKEKLFEIAIFEEVVYIYITIKSMTGWFGVL